MKFSRAGDALTVACPAKVNLFLEVRGRRPDGYHEIETVMQAVTLYDELVLRPRPGRGVTFRCSDPALPRDGRNLAYAAAERLDAAVGLPEGVSVRLEKRIPAGAGLGGGSSDAAGVLAGLDRLFGLGRSLEELSELGAGLGSDVPFFLRGGTALCRGRGDQVDAVTCGLVGHYVICCPEQGVSTGEAYGYLSRMGLTKNDRSARLILDSLASGQPDRVREHLFNRLGEVAERLVPDVGKVRRLLAASASQVALVSGSGSAVFCLFGTAEDAAVVAERMRAQDVARVFVARSEAAADASD
ncbi:MAG: 4-(cytidine 5'-diphospho)-2-C-methyl-D-erythritol kinase [Planctomycetota bacterium]